MRLIYDFIKNDLKSEILNIMVMFVISIFTILLGLVFVASFI
jgi:hypothetical protein